MPLSLSLCMCVCVRACCCVCVCAVVCCCVCVGVCVWVRLGAPVWGHPFGFFSLALGRKPAFGFFFPWRRAGHPFVGQMRAGHPFQAICRADGGRTGPDTPWSGKRGFWGGPDASLVLWTEVPGGTRAGGWPKMCPKKIRPA